MKDNSVDIVSLLEKLPKEKSSIALSLLNPLQREVIDLLAKKRVCLSAFEIRKALIHRWFDMVWSRVVDLHRGCYVNVEGDSIKITNNYPVPISLQFLHMLPDCCP